MLHDHLPSVRTRPATGRILNTIGEDFRGSHTNWPIVGEFDTMKNVNGSKITIEVMHCGKQWLSLQRD